MMVTLKTERDLNDANSERLKNMEATLKSLENAQAWMKKQAA